MHLWYGASHIEACHWSPHQENRDLQHKHNYWLNGSYMTCWIPKQTFFIEIVETFRSYFWHWPSLTCPLIYGTESLNIWSQHIELNTWNFSCQNPSSAEWPERFSGNSCKFQECNWMCYNTSNPFHILLPTRIWCFLQSFKQFLSLDTTLGMFSVMVHGTKELTENVILRVRAFFHKTVRVCHVYCNFKIGFTCRITVIFGTLKDGSLLINTLASNIFFNYRNIFQNGVDALPKIVDAFLSKSSNFHLVRTIR